jgi:acetyl-CoA C-acetyltransferase
MRKVSVIGVGETAMGKHMGNSLAMMIKEAGHKAIADANITKDQIQALYMGNFVAQNLCGQGHMGAYAAEALDLGAIPSIRMEGACASGSLAFRQAYISVACGIYDIVLVGGVEKMTHQPTDKVTEAVAGAADYDQEALNGMTFPSIFAMIANRYQYQYGNVREAMAMCAVQNHENALLNPDSHLKKRITIDDVIHGIKISYPFTIMDCSPVTDGSVFLVLACEEKARELKGDKAAVILGSGHNGNTISISSKKDITTFDATLAAAKEAYCMAGVKPHDIDMAEVHDCFTITQIINIEDLGFAQKGQGGRTVLNGETTRNGRIPINVSGGLKGKGHPIGATGLSQIYEVVTQLRGEAGERQIKKIDVGLTQNLGGTAGTCLVHIFGRGSR